VFGDGIGGAVQMPLDEMETLSVLAVRVAILRARIRHGLTFFRQRVRNEGVLILDLGKLVAAARSPKPARMANDLSASAKYVLAHVSVGQNRATSSSRRMGTTLYVANRLDDTISVVDTARAAVTATFALGDPAPATAERRGERLFYSSSTHSANSSAAPDLPYRLPTFRRPSVGPGA